MQPAALGLQLKNLVRAIQPVRATPQALPLTNLEGKVLLLHAVDHALLSVHEMDALRQTLRPLAGRCTLTFDDGYAHTWPLLKCLAQDGHRIILFVCTQALTQRYLPKDRLLLTCLNMPGGRCLDVGQVRLRAWSAGQPYRFWMGFTLNRYLMATQGRDAYAELIDKATAPYWDHCVGQPNAKGLEMATLAELRELIAAHPGIEVGLHGHSHYRVDLLRNESEFMAEVDAPALRLSEAIGRPVSQFAPPYGLTNPQTNRRLSDRFEAIHLLADQKDADGAQHAVLRLSIDRCRLLPDA
jgi:peptidoglycan/xylan/chitin deacetylase (PgdA/CDA1 family)